MSSNPGENAGKKSQIFLARTFGARDVSTRTLLGKRAKYEPLAGQSVHQLSIFACFLCMEVINKAKCREK